MANKATIQVIFDDKQAKKEIKAVDRRVDSLSESFKKASKTIKPVNTRVKSLNESFKKASKTIKSFNTRVKSLNRSFKDVSVKSGIGFAALSGIILGLTKTFSKLEDGLTNIATLLSPEEFQKFDTVIKTQVTESMRNFGFSIEDSTKAMFDNISALGANEKAFKTFESAQRLSVGGVTSLSTAVTGITSIVNAYGKELTDSGDVASAFFTAQRFGTTTVEKLALTIGRVAPVAKLAGIGFEELLAATAQLTLGGLSTEEATVGLRQAILGLIQPTGEARDILKSFGVPVGVSELRAKGFRFALERLAVVAKENPDLIGKMVTNIRALTAIASLGTKELNNLDKITEEIGNDSVKAAEGLDSLTLAVEKQQATLSSAFKELSGSTTVLSASIGEALAPTIKALAKSLKSLADTFNELSPATKKIIANILLFGAALTGLITIIGLLGVALTSGLLLVLNPIGLAIVGIGAALAGLVVAWRTNFLGIKQITERFGVFFFAFTQALINNFKLIGRVFKSALKFDFSGIKEDFRLFGIESTRISNEFIDNLDKIKQKAFQAEFVGPRFPLFLPLSAAPTTTPTTTTPPTVTPPTAAAPSAPQEDFLAIVSLRKALNASLLALTGRQNLEELRLLEERIEQQREIELENFTIRRQILEEQGLIDNQLTEELRNKEAEINAKFDAEELARQKKIQKERQRFQISDLQSLKGFLGDVGKAFREAAQALKIIRLGEAIVNIAAGIANALAGPFPINIANAAIVTAQGAAQIATIQAQQFQEGAINIPQQIPAILDPGEMVLTRSIAEGVRSGELTVGGRESVGEGRNVVFNIDFNGAEFVGLTDDMVDELETKLIEKLNVIGGGLQLVET